MFHAADHAADHAAQTVIYRADGTFGHHYVLFIISEKFKVWDNIVSVFRE